ncbi:hypothetical protein CPB85DRAFT_1319337 [Mucidula mucida]|nr:hypothetical protein CPB85DRAFT_1319337 [Mucidula mucida]
MRAFVGAFVLPFPSYVVSELDSLMQLDLPSVRRDHGGGDAVAHYCSQAHPNVERTKCWIRIPGTTRNYLGSQKLGVTKIL